MWTIKTEEDWMKVYLDQGKKVRTCDYRWIPVLDVNNLPPKDVWVQLLENDELNTSDKYWSELFKKPAIRVGVAMLKEIDYEGNAYWYRGYVGGSPINFGRNVTHFQYLTKAPVIEPFPYE